jgi:hypothetical protein
MPTVYVYRGCCTAHRPPAFSMDIAAVAAFGGQRTGYLEAAKAGRIK